MAITEDHIDITRLTSTIGRLMTDRRPEHYIALIKAIRVAYPQMSLGAAKDHADRIIADETHPERCRNARVILATVRAALLNAGLTGDEMVAVWKAERPVTGEPWSEYYGD